jgi:hypothetical protein
MTEVVVLRPGETFTREEGRTRWRRNNGPAIWTQTGPTHFVCSDRLDKKTADEWQRKIGNAKSLTMTRPSAGSFPRSKR